MHAHAPSRPRQGTPKPRAVIAAWVLAAMLCGCVLAVYAPSFGNAFIYDDEHVIVNAPAPTSLSDIGRIFAERHFPNLPYYRPITRATLLLQKSLSPNAAWPFHAGNAVLIAAAALLVFALLRVAAFGLR